MGPEALRQDEDRGERGAHCGRCPDGVQRGGGRNPGLEPRGQATGHGGSTNNLLLPLIILYGVAILVCAVLCSAIEFPVCSPFDFLFSYACLFTPIYKGARHH